MDNLIRTYSKKEIAELYGISTKTLRRWCERAGISLGKEKLIHPCKVKLMFEHFGPPSEIFISN